MTPESANDESRWERIGPWRLERTLGRGGAGTVFAGRGPDGRQVAVKVPDEGGVRAAWLLHEARFAARLRHPHIVQLEGRGRLADGRPYLVYELVEGRALDVCADTLAARDVVRIGDELLAALSYAHDAGVLHLDLSPANVLLDREGRTKLTDFGLAMSDDRRSRDASRRALVAGTPGYLSPEQALGAGGVGPRADIYGAGALLYRLIAGYPPHGGGDSTEVIQRTLHGEPLPLSPRPGILLGDAACALVERMIARDPEARPASAAAARRAWLEATDALTVLRDGPPSTATPAMPLRRSATLMATEFGEALAATDTLRSTRRTRRRTAPATAATARSAIARVGRDAELAALRAQDPEAGPTWLVGPRGVGLSRLLDWHAEQLAHDDVVVARTTARRGLAAPPLEVLAALALDLTEGFGLPAWAAAERLVGTIDRLDTRGLQAAKVALAGALLGAGHPVTHATRMECFRVMEALRPPGRPLALLVDDADHLDGASDDVLRRLAATGVRVVLAGQHGRQGDPRIRVAAPTTAEALEIAERAGAANPERAVRVLGTAPAPLVTWACHDAIDPRAAGIEALGEEARAILGAARIFGGRHVPGRALADVAATASAPDAIPSLANLIVPVRHASARLEPWVALGDPALERIAITGQTEGTLERAVRWLARECRDQSHGVQAWMAELALSAGQRERAAYGTAEAGRRAAACDAPEAHELLARALELSAEVPEAIDRAAVLADLATLEQHSAPTTALERAGAAFLAADPDRHVLRARMKRLEAQVRIDQRRSTDALALLDEAIALLGATPDPEELAELLSSKGWVLGYLMGDNDAGIALGMEALAIAGQVDTPAFQARLCGKLGANQLRAGDWDGQLATNLRDLGLSGQAQDVFGTMRAHINLGVCFTNRGLLALARAHTAEAARLADAHGALRAGQIAWNNLAMIAADDRRWADARAAADESRERSAGGSMDVAETWDVLLRCHLAAGEKDAAREALEQLEAAATGAERALATRARARLQSPREARVALAQLLAEGVGDPYERAKTELALAAAERRAGDLDAARGLEARADEVLEELGADPTLERGRNVSW
ncbi:MAG: hypothetical protein CMN30_29875 [Sandaracinus sp.]|nr:hypothetical protein [Sandaracinus sp.]